MTEQLNVYIILQADAFWGFPSTSIVVAPNEQEAIKMIDEKLSQHNLKTYAESPYDVVLVDNSHTHVARFDAGEDY